MTAFRPTCVHLWSSIRDLMAWVVFEAHIEPLEVWTGTYALVWGLWVWNPWMDVFASAPGFHAMALAPEWLWGFVLTIGGVIQFAGRLSGRPAWQRFGAISILAVWLFAAGALGYQNWRFPSTVTYPLLALGSLLVAYRAAPIPKRHAAVTHADCS